MVIQGKEKQNMLEEVIGIIDGFLKDKVVTISREGMAEHDDSTQNYFKPSDVRTALIMLFDETLMRVNIMGGIETVRLDDFCKRILTDHGFSGNLGDGQAICDWLKNSHHTTIYITATDTLKGTIHTYSIERMAGYKLGDHVRENAGNIITYHIGYDDFHRTMTAAIKNALALTT